MIRMQLSDIAKVLNAPLTGEDVSIEGVCTDSRHLQPGQLFIALQGDRFDGHGFLAHAAEAGAAAALVARRSEAALPMVQVGDTRLALGSLASHWRETFATRIVAVTGSNGKTTVKEMLAAILGGVGDVLATEGNFNNDIGLPLTLARLQGESHAVIEMGANHKGEIDYLTRLTRPDVALINNAARAHLEGFGSIEDVARAKGEIFNGLSERGVAVFNGDDTYAGLWREFTADHQQLTFGFDQGNNVFSDPDAVLMEWIDDGYQMGFPVITPVGEFYAELQLAGGHNQKNALAATAAAIALGIDLPDIEAGLRRVSGAPGRLQAVAGINHSRLVDDSYNANPDSVHAAIRVLAAAPGRRTLVMGDLAELGAGSDKLHAELGAAARASGVDRLLTCGRDSAHAAASFGMGSIHFTNQNELIDELAETLSEEDTVLIKGSRAAAMDRVVAALRAEQS